MLEAAIYAALAASSLLVGMFIAFIWRVGTRPLGLVLAFGAGALFSAIAFELTETALDHGSEALLAAGMLVGAVTYVGGSRLLGPRGGAAESNDSDAKSIVLGATLDGIPESLAIDATVASAGAGSAGISLALPVAVALSNLPESLGATIGLRDAGHSKRSIVLLWSGLVAMSAIAAAIGYIVLERVDESVAAFLDAFTAGAVLAMLTDTMIPDAYRDVGRAAGLASVIGFAAAFLLA